VKRERAAAKERKELKGIVSLRSVCPIAADFILYVPARSFASLRFLSFGIWDFF
jgi:hypothetical protein